LHRAAFGAVQVSKPAIPGLDMPGNRWLLDPRSHFDRLTSFRRLFPEVKMAFHKINIIVNGGLEQVVVPSNMTLLRMLRETLSLTGTKNGCSAGECGACTVLMNGEPINSCMILAVECEGANIVTVEGLADDKRLDPIQEAMIQEGGVQCGFCTPGVLMTSRALLDRNPNPSEDEIHRALVGNLCRCTGYVRIFESVKKAAKKQRVAS
jgi:carbon-monoxide dehydrogenase small subunit